MIYSVPFAGALHVRPESGCQPFHRRVVRPRGRRPQRRGGRGGRWWQPLPFPLPLPLRALRRPGASQALQLARLDVAAYRVLDDLGHPVHGVVLRSRQVLPRVPWDAGRLHVGPAAAPAVGRRRGRRGVMPALRRRDVLLLRRQISLQLARNEIAHRAVTRRRLAVRVVMLLVRMVRRLLLLRR